MKKRLIIYAVSLLALLVGTYVLAYLYPSRTVFTVLIPPQQYPTKDLKIHSYGNPEESANQVLVRVYYCLLPDNKSLAAEDWKKTLSQTMAEVGEFYHLQFSNEMEVNFEIYPELIQMATSSSYFTQLLIDDFKKELAEPHSKSQTMKAVVSQVEDKIANETKWQLDQRRIDKAYVINLFVLGIDIKKLQEQGIVIGGLTDEDSNNSLVFASGFSDDEHKAYYGSVVAHEIGHSLRIPEFYSYTNNEIESAGIMGGGYSKPLKDNYLEIQIKEKMMDK